MNDVLREELLRSGAIVVGFACVRGILGKDIAHLERAVSIGVDRNLNQDTVHLLLALQKKAARLLKLGGHRYLCIPPDSDRVRNTFVSRLYPLFTHKIAATSAGIGWIGKNGLLITREFGPRLSLATVLTDAPLETGVPMESSQCGECRLCLDFCPSEAITGEHWTRSDPFVELVQPEKCKSHKKSTRRLSGKPNCGLCINICP